MSRASRRSAVAVALIAFFALALSACGGDSKTSAATPGSSRPDGLDLTGVTLHVGDQASIAKTLLSASGQDKGVSYKISFSDFASGPPLLEALNANAIDVGGVGDAPPIFAQSSGAKIDIVAVSAARNADQSALAIIVPKGSPAQSVADLKGKKVGLAQGSASHWHLLAALGQVGLSFADITPAYLQPPDALAAFNGGNLDAWAIWDPYRSLAESQGARVISTGAGLVGGFGFQVSRPGVLGDPRQSAALGDYLQRLAAAQDWAASHQDEWTAQYAQLTKLPPDIAAKTFQHFQLRYFPIDDKVVAAQQQEADAFKQAGLIPSAVTVKDVFDTRYATELGAPASASPSS
jgi:sulfonate transport system substrate-binding protein